MSYLQIIPDTSSHTQDNNGPINALHLVQGVEQLQQAIGPHEDLTMVKRRKLQWCGQVPRSSGLAKTSLQGTVKGGRRHGRQRKRRKGNIREWTGLEFAKSQRAVENRENGRKWLRNHLWCPNDPRG